MTPTRPSRRLAPLAPFALLLLLGACAGLRPPSVQPMSSMSADGTNGGTNGGGPPESAAAASAGKDDDDDDGHGLLLTLLLYLPNRVIDLFDVARFGVDVGPGIGVHVQATEMLQAKALTSTSVGAGLQTLRHSPVHVGARAGLGVGPVEGTADIGDWYQSPADVRVELYALLVGAHVAIEPVEILDAVLGFLFIDLAGDDL